MPPRDTNIYLLYLLKNIYLIWIYPYKCSHIGNLILAKEYKYVLPLQQFKTLTHNTMNVFKCILLTAVAALVIACLALTVEQHQTLVQGTSIDSRAEAVQLWRDQTYMLGIIALMATGVFFLIAADKKA